MMVQDDEYVGLLQVASCLTCRTANSIEGLCFYKILL